MSKTVKYRKIGGIEFRIPEAGIIIEPEDHNNVKTLLGIIDELFMENYGGYITHPDIPTLINNIPHRKKGDYIYATDWNSILQILRSYLEELEAHGVAEEKLANYKLYLNMLSNVSGGDLVLSYHYATRLDALEELYNLVSQLPPITCPRIIIEECWEFETIEELEDFATEKKNATVQNGQIIFQVEEGDTGYVKREDSEPYYKTAICFFPKLEKAEVEEEVLTVMSLDVGASVKTIVGELEKLQLVTIPEGITRQFEIPPGGTLLVVDYEMHKARIYNKQGDILAEADLRYRSPDAPFVSSIFIKGDTKQEDLRLRNRVDFACLQYETCIASPYNPLWMPEEGWSELWEFYTEDEVKEFANELRRYATASKGKLVFETPEGTWGTARHSVSQVLCKKVAMCFSLEVLEITEPAEADICRAIRCAKPSYISVAVSCHTTDTDKAILEVDYGGKATFILDPTCMVFVVDYENMETYVYNNRGELLASLPLAEGSCDTYGIRVWAQEFNRDLGTLNKTKVYWVAISYQEVGG